MKIIIFLFVFAFASLFLFRNYNKKSTFDDLNNKTEYYLFGIKIFERSDGQGVQSSKNSQDISLDAGSVEITSRDNFPSDIEKIFDEIFSYRLKNKIWPDINQVEDAIRKVSSKIMINKYRVINLSNGKAIVELSVTDQSFNAGPKLYRKGFDSK